MSKIQLRDQNPGLYLTFNFYPYLLLMNFYLFINTLNFQFILLDVYISFFIFTLDFLYIKNMLEKLVY
jgi:hypothetical protein